MSAPATPGPIIRAIRFIRMAGTSIAALDAAPWVTDFLNAAEGGDRLLGPDFSEGYLDRARRAWGIVFDSVEARGSYRPEARLARSRLGALTPPVAEPGERVWKTYQPVPVADLDVLLRRLTTPECWPDHASDHGRFTPLRQGGLPGQTFEIEVVAGAGTRHPLAPR